MKTWVIRIAINYCKDLSRKKRSLLSTEELLAKDGEEMESGGKADPYESLLESGICSKAIMSLGRKEREVLILYYYQELSQKEIAGILGTREGTVSQRIHRAKAKLKEALKEAGYDGEI